MKEHKFKVGDRVHVVDDKDLYYGQTGVVINVTNEEPMYRIQLDDGDKGWEYEEDLKAVTVLEEVTIPKYHPGDRFVIEVESILTGEDGTPLYKIKGFNALVFDNSGLDRLERAENKEVIDIKEHYAEIYKELAGARARATMIADKISSVKMILDNIKNGNNG